MAQVHVELGHLPFDDYKVKYRCCCSCMHVKTGTYVMGVLSLFSIVRSFGGVTRLHDGEYLDFVDTAIGLISLFAVICLFVGLVKNKKHLLIPSIVLQVVTCMVSVAICISLIWAMIDPDSLPGRIISNIVHSEEQVKKTITETEDLEKKTKIHIEAMAFLFLVAFAIAAFLQFLIYRLYRKCYNYLVDLEEHIKQSGNHKEFNTVTPSAPSQSS